MCFKKQLKIHSKFQISKAFSTLPPQLKFYFLQVKYLNTNFVFQLFLHFEVYFWNLVNLWCFSTSAIELQFQNPESKRRKFCLRLKNNRLSTLTPQLW